MTNDQEHALAFLDEFLADIIKRGKKHGQELFACLQGYAGVGKTWIVAHWAELVLAKNPGFRIIMTAPTNKAVDVMRTKCGHLPVDFRTLDSLLGFKIKRDDDWKVQRSRSSKKGQEQEHIDLVIVDEASMVKKEYHLELGYIGSAVLYVGDPAQLNPIGEEFSHAFAIDRKLLMVEPTRQAADSPIHGLADFLRQRVEDKRDFVLQDLRALGAKDGRVTFTGHNNIHDWACRASERGLDCRILGFTNACVHEHNAIMHNRMYPDHELFGPGELALVNEAFEYDDDTLLTNGELLRVVSASEVEPICDIRTFDVTALRLHNSLAVDGATVGEPLTMQVALDAEHAVRVHRELTDQIYTARKQGRVSLSDELLERRRPLNKLAPLRHSFSNTIHKSQGSTYDVAICDFPDIYRSKDMRARLLYVGFTRPSEYLCISCTRG